jgi:DNA invertase Pin-like site-specific DNA recombinase
MRTAAYARFSSDLQRQTSLDDQIRTCREWAARHGWSWQDHHVYTDAAISGVSIEGRAGLQALLTAAYADDCPFDVILVDDSSRVSRDLADALRIIQRLKFAGIRVIYITQGIDSASEAAETLIAVHGIVDSLYLREMAAKIKRGLKGQLSRGFATGGRTYGYGTEPVADPHRPGETLGWRVAIEPAEAAAIQTICAWYADGVSVPQIITRLTEGSFPPPRGGSWRVGAIQRILRNPKYRGQLVWGRTQQTRKPGSRTKVIRRVPEHHWQTVERPELRIVSEPLWERVQARRRSTDALLTPQRQLGRGLLRGRNAKLYSETLFSGFMKCSVCGGAFNVVNNRVINGVRYRYYGCAKHSRNGTSVCNNRVKIRVEAADRALLAGLQTELLHPETVTYIAERLTAALTTVLDQRPGQREDIARRRAIADDKLRNLIAAVENGAGTPTIFQAIQEREAEIRALEGQITALTEPVEHRMAIVPSWVRQQLEDVAGLVGEVPERARAEFLRLNIRFVLQPVYEGNAAPFLRAVGSGDFEHLAFSQYAAFPTTVASNLRSIRRTAPRRHGL